MRRREFIAGLGSAAGWPVVRGAAAVDAGDWVSQPQSVEDSKFLTPAFLQGLKETGYVEGENVAIEYRWAENQFDRLPALAADLVRRRVAVIVTSAARCRAVPNLWNGRVLLMNGVAVAGGAVRAQGEDSHNDSGVA
jgi:hypothetical protein